MDFAGIVIHGSQIGRNGRSGIRLSSGSPRKLRHCSVRDNQIFSNGKAGIVGDRAGVLVDVGTTMERGRIQDNDIYDLQATKTQKLSIGLMTGTTMSNVIIKGNTGEGDPPVYKYAANGTAAAATVAAKTLPNGSLADRPWTILDTGSGGVWSYTGTTMKPTAGTDRVIAYVDLSDKVTTDPEFAYGMASAKVAALATPSNDTFIGLAVNVNGATSYLYFGPRYNAGAWKYRFARRNGASDSSVTDVVQTPVVGDTYGISLDGSTARCYVNVVLVHAFPWSVTHYGRWGMLGSFSTDPTSALKEFKYQSNERGA